MKELFISALFGIVQGITELLPISSSAHIAIVERLTSTHISLANEAILNIGSFIAIAIYFRADIIKLFKDFINLPFSKDNLIYKLIISSIPVLLLAFIFKDIIETFKYNMSLIAVSLILLGVVLYISDKYIPTKIDIDKLSTKNYLYLGFMQVLSLVRGISRSGITITSSRFLGLNREDSVKTSFLMSLPVMFIISVYGIYGSFIKGGEDITLCLLVGFIFSLLGSYFTIKILLNFVKKNSFLPFAIYRVVLGILILIFLL